MYHLCSQLKLLVLLALCLRWTVARLEKHKPVVVTPDMEKLRDPEGYASIAEIHREMDDDHSGSIDRQETTGFMTEDMHMRSSDRLRRENAFHGDDDSITVDDLWEAWFESIERQWTTDQIVDWVSNVMNLPQYADKIRSLNVDGRALPRLACPNATFMAQTLGIKSSVHRQKLRLNALDVVLFGFRDNSSRSKDIALALLALLLTSVLILYVNQRRRAKLHVQELSSRLTQLKTMETEFDDVQKKWAEERNRRSTADGGLHASEVEHLRIQLEEAEKRLEQNGQSNGAPLSMQPLLRKTCEKEMATLEKQRQECFKEMKEAIEMVDRLQKKQSSFVSSLKLATGAASASDQVDSKIFALKSRMEGIHMTSLDSQERWLQIESLCGFPILYTNEAGDHFTASSQGHFYSNHSGTSSISSRSLTGAPTSSNGGRPMGSAQTPTAPPPVAQRLPTFQAGPPGAGSSFPARDPFKAAPAALPTVALASPANNTTTVRMTPLVSEPKPLATNGICESELSPNVDGVVKKRNKGFLKTMFRKTKSSTAFTSK